MNARSFARYVLVALGLVVLALFLWKIVPLLMLVFGGIVLATAIHAGSAPLARRLHLRPSIAVAIVVLAVLGALACAGWLFGRQISDQAEEMTTALQQATQRVEDFLDQSAIGTRIVGEVRSAANSETVKRVAQGTLTAFGGLLDVLLVLVMALYLAADPDRYRRGALHLIPPSARSPVGEALDDAASALRRWLLGQLASMTVVGIATGIGLWLVGVPMALPLGVLAGLLDFVPVIGPFASAVPAVLLGFSQSPQTALWAAAVYLVVQFCEGHFIVPLVQKWAVSLPPALGLVGVVVFGILFGVIGVLFSMPLLVVAVTLVEHLYVRPMQHTA